MALIMILAILAILVLYFISCQRSFISWQEKIKNALSNIAVQQKSRWDALKQIAKSAKAYKLHEAETLVNLTAARSGKVATSAKEVQASDKDFLAALHNLNVVVEAYPELKADGLYAQTMSSINGYEDKVRLSRQVYNDCVTQYNRLVKQLPSSIVANILHFTEENYLEFEQASSAMPDLDL